MRMRSVGLLLLAGLVFPAALGAQSFHKEIPLLGLGNGNPAKPFGITAEPVTNRLFVALSGDFASPNDTVVEIDAATCSVVRTIAVGGFPEDIAITYDVLGQPQYGAVTNSNDGTVSIWDVASGAVVATVPLPDPLGFGTCFPFGIAAGGPGFYVSTVDGSGDVHAIDLNGFSHDPFSSFNLGPKAGGRLRPWNGKIVVPTTQFTPTFSGSGAGLAGWGTSPFPVFCWDRLTAYEEGTGLFPSGQDAVVLPDGRLILGGTFFGGRLYVFEPSGGALQRTLRMSTALGAQGLALDPNGQLLAVCDLATNTVTLLDVVNFKEISVTAVDGVGTGYSQPNEAVFLGGKLFVTPQGSEAVLVFDNLPTIVPGPGYAGSISVTDTTPLPGSSITVTVTGAGVVALLGAFDDVPGPFMGVDLDIGPNPQILGWGSGSFTRTIALPPNPALRGLNLFAQGVSDANGTPGTTEPRAAVIQ